MNLNEYIKSRIADVRAYLKGINYANLKAENVIENLSPELDLMFNKTPAYRKETNIFLISIRNAYAHLVDDELEFASSIEEVETAIHEFELTIKNLIKVFKNNILTTYGKETGYKVNSINNDLSFIQIRIRRRDEKMSPDELHKYNELDGLREIIPCIYTFICEIEDKSIKSSKLLDLINATYEVGSPEYIKAMGNYMGSVLNERNYDNFIELYNAELEKLGFSSEEEKDVSSSPKSRS